MSSALSSSNRWWRRDAAVREAEELPEPRAGRDPQVGTELSRTPTTSRAASVVAGEEEAAAELAGPEAVEAVVHRSGC